MHQGDDSYRGTYAFRHCHTLQQKLPKHVRTTSKF